MLARLNRTDYFMLSCVRMLSCMSILRRIATPHLTAAQTDSQVDPFIAHLYALFAFVFRWFQVFRLLNVFTGVHGCLPGY